MRKKIEVDKYVEEKEMEWKVNLNGLMREIISGYPGHGSAALRAPMQILLGIMYELGECAARINDPILNGLMCRLAIYEISDPYASGYDKEMMEKVMKKYNEAKRKIK